MVLRTPRAWQCPASMTSSSARVLIGILPKAHPLILWWLAASLRWARFSLLNASVVQHMQYGNLVSFAEPTPTAACLCCGRRSKCNFKPWAAC